jgi:DNA-binding HxlR family transcriptional regulator
VEITLKALSTKWKILIVRDLSHGTRRFTELKNSLECISPKVLTNSLKSMEQDGLVVRKVYAEVPPRTEYSLTELGETLVPIILELGDWGEKHRDIAGQLGCNPA